MIGKVDILKRQKSLAGQLIETRNNTKSLPQLNSNNFNQLRYLINVLRQISGNFNNTNAILDYGIVPYVCYWQMNYKSII